MEKATTQSKNEPIINLKYKISLENYLYYNLLYAHEAFAKKRRKAMFTGLLELITGGIFFYAILQGGFANQEMLIILSALLVGLGLYSICFYRWIFPASLKKSAKEQYEKNPYLQNPVQMTFYSNRLEEQAEEAENTYKWNEVESFGRSEKLYFITIAGKRSILIPKEELEEQRFLLEELLETLSQKYKKPYKLWVEK